MTKLTNRSVQAAQDDSEGRDVVLWDEGLPGFGFGLRLRPPYGRFYIVQYRNALGRTRKLTLGRVGVLTPVEARKLAREKLAAVALGKDPAAARDTAREAVTVAELCAEYLEAEERAKRIKASTLRMDRSRIERHVKPLLGRRPVQSVTTADLEKFMTSVIEGKTAQKVEGKRPRGGIASGGQGVASRTMSMLHAVLQRAVRHGVIDKNPATGIRRPKEVERKPPFSLEAVKRLGLAITEMEAKGKIRPAYLPSGCYY